MNANANQGRMLDRAIDILECVESARTPVKPMQIAKATGLHITTTQRIAATLIRRGYLTSTPSGYLLGPTVLAHAHAFVLQDRLTMASNPVLSEMTEATGMTSSVYVRTGLSRILVARIEAPTPLRYQFPIGLRLRLDVGSGKVLLAQMPDAELDAYLAEYADTTLANRTPQTAATLREDIETIRAQQTYIGQSERHLGMISITAAIATSAGEPAGAINLVSNDDAIAPETVAEHRRLLLQASRRIGEQL